jgi:hypothetical protein
MQPEITLGVPASLLKPDPILLQPDTIWLPILESNQAAKSGFYPSLKLLRLEKFQSID